MHVSSGVLSMGRREPLHATRLEPLGYALPCPHAWQALEYVCIRLSMHMLFILQGNPDVPLEARPCLQPMHGTM